VSVEVDDEVGVLLVLVLAGRLRDTGFGSGKSRTVQYDENPNECGRRRRDKVGDKEGLPKSVGRQYRAATPPICG
jgi:hypothetical protein